MPNGNIHVENVAFLSSPIYSSCDLCPPYGDVSISAIFGNLIIVGWGAAHAKGSAPAFSSVSASTACPIGASSLPTIWKTAPALRSRSAISPQS